MMKNGLTLLAKKVLPFTGLAAAVSAANAAIQKKIFESRMARLIFSNEELDDIMKIVKPLENAGLLIKDVNKTLEGEMSAAISYSILLGRMLAGKGVIRHRDIRAAQDF